MPSRLRHLVDRDSYGVGVLTASVPLLFLHERFQPEYGVGLGSTTVDIRVSDVALMLVFATALVVAVQRGIERLRPGRGLWLVGAMFLAWMAFETLRPASTGDALFDEHLVSFFKLGEYERSPDGTQENFAILHALYRYHREGDSVLRSVPFLFRYESEKDSSTLYLFHLIPIRL